MSDMVREEILQACVNYQSDLAKTVKNKKEAGITGGMEADLLGRVSALTEELYTKGLALDAAVAQAPSADAETVANYYHDTILPALDAVRAPADQLEMLVGKKYWPFPTYSAIPFYG